MDTYGFTFDGHYLEGNGIVQASTPEEAMVKAKAIVAKEEPNLSTEDMTVYQLDLTKGEILFNGDY